MAFTADMSEQERAAEYRAQQSRRADAEQARLATLAGDDEAASAVRTAWQPRLDALLPQPPEPLPGDLEPAPVPPRVPGWIELPERYRRSHP